MEVGSRYCLSTWAHRATALVITLVFTYCTACTCKYKSYNDDTSRVLYLPSHPNLSLPARLSLPPRKYLICQVHLQCQPLPAIASYLPITTYSFAHKFCLKRRIIIPEHDLIGLVERYLPLSRNSLKSTYSNSIPQAS